MKGCLSFLIILGLVWVIPMTMVAHGILTLFVVGIGFGQWLKWGEREHRIERHRRRPEEMREARRRNQQRGN